jgi:tripartite-type tricarboxylate transporter receptor subunit TctC
MIMSLKVLFMQHTQRLSLPIAFLPLKKLAQTLAPVFILALTLFGGFPSQAQVQGPNALGTSPAYPTKPITLVVPFPPGGVADIVARPVAEAMGRDLGQAVIIENKPGAGGGIGMGFVAHAKADGYTLLMALSSLSVLPQADTVLGRNPLFVHKDLRAIARFTADPTVLVVKADSTWKTTQDFIEDAKKRPGAISFGSSGNFGTMHVPMEMLSQQSGIQLNHIPYTGAGPAVVALLGGQIDAVSTGPATVVQHIKSGKLRALAHWGNTKLEALPDTNSLKDQKIAAEYAQWSGLFIPSATPEGFAQRIRSSAKAAALDPKVIEAIQNAGSPMAYLDAPEFERYLSEDIKKMTEVVKKMNVKGM